MMANFLTSKTQINMKDLSDYRKNYQQKELVETNLPQSPLELFEIWFSENELIDPEIESNAMTIATIGLDGFPKSRVVLLKAFDDKGFVFYTNYDSQKGKSILKNPQVCLSFFWQKLERQVIIKGVATKIDSKKSDAYFASRPRGSQIGAIISNQSEVIENREILEQRQNNFETQADQTLLHRPPNWGGFEVNPIEIEFWQGRSNRLHDRIRYQLADQKWVINRLAP